MAEYRTNRSHIDQEKFCWTLFLSYQAFHVENKMNGKNLENERYYSWVEEGDEREKGILKKQLMPSLQ